MAESPAADRTCKRCTDLFLVALIAAAFFGMQFTASVQQGVLSVPVTYDDNTYLLDASERLQLLYDEGSGAFLKSLVSDPPHSPLATLHCIAGLALFGWTSRSPVLLNATLLFALMAVLRWRMAQEDRWPFVGLAFACLSWPIASFLAIELRPDVTCALLTSLGVAGLFWRPWSEAQAGAARWSGVCFGLALLAKPAITPLTAGVLLIGWVCAIGCDRLERGTSLRELTTGAGSARFLAYVVSIPFVFLLFSWRYFYRYVVEVMLSERSGIWTTVDVPSPRILYYLTARGGGRDAMGSWLWIALALGALAMALSWLLRRPLPWIRIGGFATTGIATLVAVTLPKELVVFNGLIVACLIYVGSTLAALWCFDVLRSVRFPRLSRFVFGVSLVGLGLGLFHFHLYYRHGGAHQIEPGPVSQRRWRLLEEVGLRLERANGSPPLVLFTTVTPYLNPQTLGFERGNGRRPRLKMLDFHRDADPARFEAALEQADAVVSFAPDSKELMGWVPSDRQLLHFNALIESDSRWSIERLDAPNGERGAILVATRSGSNGDVR